MVKVLLYSPVGPLNKGVLALVKFNILSRVYLWIFLWISQETTVISQLKVKILFYLKGKAIPLQAWTGPEGSRRLRFPDFKTIGT